MKRGTGTELGLIILAIVAAIMALVWWVFDGSTTWPRTTRSRLTIVVDTPEGERSGSSVSQSTTHFPGGMTRAQGWAVMGKLVGEAVVVDLGARGLLFATFERQSTLLHGGGDAYNAGLAPFPQEKFRGETGSGIWAKDEYAAYLDEVNRRKPKGELPFKDLPVLVRFREPNDPTSVELVDPFNLAASFGSGVTFKRATVEITDDPITRGIEDRLPWLKTSSEAPTLFPQTSLPIYQRDTLPVQNLRFSDFRRLPR